MHPYILDSTRIQQLTKINFYLNKTNKYKNITLKRHASVTSKKSLGKRVLLPLQISYHSLEYMLRPLTFTFSVQLKVKNTEISKILNQTLL